nr:chromosome segregation protein SMC [Treponema sp.]
LDSKLKDVGFSDSAIKNAKENLEITLGKLKIFSEGRKNIISDFIAIPSHSTNDYEKIVKELSEAFEEINNLVKDIEQSLESYIKSSPAFITEFLSPEGIMTKKRSIDTQISDNRNKIKEINAHIDELHSENTDLAEKINEYKDTLNKLKLNQVQMQEQISSAENQASLLRRTLASEQNSLRTTEDELFNENRRAEEMNDQIISAQEELAEIEQQGLKLADEMRKLDDEIAKSNDNVSGKKGALTKKQEEHNRCQAQYEKLSLSLASSDTEIRNIKQNFQDQHSRDLMEFEEHMYKITTPVAELRDKLSTAKEAFKSLGQVNLMAVEEFAEVKDRYERQKANYDDTQKSLDNLIRVSEEIKSKSSEMFLETYNKIKKNFHNMFRRLFNGGRAELKLADPQNVLTSGIDILAQPPGKKLESIALLSGGEKTMTAVALLFATYQVRPSPFCLLDEIDAALDDKNVSSFVNTLETFSSVSQYIVITHNKKTVMGASTMLGITMEESGVSKIIALRLDQDIKVGAKVDAPDENFIEEDVPPEEGTYIPPRPPKRIYNPDGTITDPEIERIKKEEKQKEEEAKRLAQEAAKAKEQESSDSNEENK